MAERDRQQEWAEIRAEHALHLGKRGIGLGCYECGQLAKVQSGYEVDTTQTVVFHPRQPESFAVLIRKRGPETTKKLRLALINPQDCRLLCPVHLERAKAGWTYRREALRRLWPNVGYAGGPGAVTTASGETVQVDEYLCGPYLDPATRAEFARWRAEWLAEDGDPPAYDGGWWACGYGLGPRP